MIVEGKPFVPICYSTEFRKDSGLPDWKYIVAEGQRLQHRPGLDGINCGPASIAAKSRRPSSSSRRPAGEIVGHGFKVMPVIGLKHPSAEKIGREKLDAYIKSLCELIKHFESEPSILGWYIMDEPCKEAETEQELRDYYQAIKRVAGNRPVFINYNWCGMSEGVEPWGGEASTDLSCLDVYPFSGWGINAPLEKYAYYTWLANSKAGRKGRVQIMWLQTYGYADGLREPSPDEFENMVWQSLIFGTRGFAYFTERPASSALWKREGELHAKIKRLEDIMLAPDHKETIPSTHPADEDVNSVVWQAGGRHYLLLANPKYEKRVITISLKTLCGKEFKTARPLFGGDPIALDDGVLRIDMPPAATGTYILE